MKWLEQIGKQLHSTALVALACPAAADPFAKIRGMIEDMVAKLLEEIETEANWKAFGHKEIGESHQGRSGFSRQAPLRVQRSPRAYRVGEGPER